MAESSAAGLRQVMLEYDGRKAMQLWKLDRALDLAERAFDAALYDSHESAALELIDNIDLRRQFLQNVESCVGDIREPHVTRSATAAAERSFTADLHDGQQAEDLLDDVFTGRFDLQPGKAPQIDRSFSTRAEPHFKVSVEYKTDFRAVQTGNVFMEICDNHTERCDALDAHSSPAWALRPHPDIELFFIWLHGRGQLIVINAEVLKSQTPLWLRDFDPRLIRSTDDGREWSTQGLPVPIEVVEEHALAGYAFKDPPAR